jgi:hypothetical protein
MTRKDLYTAIAEKLSGQRGAAMRATLQQSIFSDLFRPRLSEEEFASQLLEAERDLSKAFQRFFQQVQERPRTWGFPN